MLPSEEGGTVNYKQNCPAWHKPYAEALLEIRSERLLTNLAATEIAAFQRLWELAADQDASGLSCVQAASSVQFGRGALRSENIESFKTPLSEEL